MEHQIVRKLPDGRLEFCIPCLVRISQAERRKMGFPKLYHPEELRRLRQQAQR